MHAFYNFISRNPSDPGLVEDFDPRVLATRASKFNKDDHSWDMVMGIPFEAGYYDAIKSETGHVLQ